MGIEPVEPMMLMWFRETVFCCFSLLWNKSWEQKDQRTLKLVTLATVLAVSNADQRRGNIVLKRLESYYQLSKGLSKLIGQIFMGGILKEQLPLRVFRVSKKSAKKAKCKDQPKNPLQERKSTTLSIQQLARRNWVLKKKNFRFWKLIFFQPCQSNADRHLEVRAGVLATAMNKKTTFQLLWWISNLFFTTPAESVLV